MTVCTGVCLPSWISGTSLGGIFFRCRMCKLCWNNRRKSARRRGRLAGSLKSTWWHASPVAPLAAGQEEWLSTRRQGAALRNVEALEARESSWESTTRASPPSRPGRRPPLPQGLALSYSPCEHPGPFDVKAGVRVGVERVVEGRAVASDALCNVATSSCCLLLTTSCRVSFLWDSQRVPCHPASSHRHR
jgi:hypothetical protein